MDKEKDIQISVALNCCKITINGVNILMDYQKRQTMFLNVCCFRKSCGVKFWMHINQIMGDYNESKNIYEISLTPGGITLCGSTDQGGVNFMCNTFLYFVQKSSYKAVVSFK